MGANGSQSCEGCCYISDDISGDSTKECVTPNDRAHSHEHFFLLGATISIICYFYVFIQYFYYKTPAFTGHPTSMAIYKYMIEAVMVSQFFVSSNGYYSILLVSNITY